MRAENFKKNKKTELENSKSPFLSYLACMRCSSQQTAPCLGVTRVKLNKPELITFSNKFLHGTEYETKLMPKRKTSNAKKTTTKKRYFQARVLKLYKPNQPSVVPVSSESTFACRLE